MNLAAIPAFASDDIFHVVVEAPRGSVLKLRYVWGDAAVALELVRESVRP